MRHVVSKHRQIPVCSIVLRRTSNKTQKLCVTSPVWCKSTCDRCMYSPHKRTKRRKYVYVLMSSREHPTYFLVVQQMELVHGRLKQSDSNSNHSVGSNIYWNPINTIIAKSISEAFKIPGTFHSRHDWAQLNTVNSLHSLLLCIYSMRYVS